MAKNLVSKLKIISVQNRSLWFLQKNKVYIQKFIIRIENFSFHHKASSLNNYQSKLYKFLKMLYYRGNEIDYNGQVHKRIKTQGQKRRNIIGNQ
jgi:hypothetical protein